MKDHGKRIDQLEQQLPTNTEPHYVGWKGYPWSEEEKAEAIEREPECLFFWRSLSSVPLRKKNKPSEGKGS